MVTGALGAAVTLDGTVVAAAFDGTVEAAVTLDGTVVAATFDGTVEAAVTLDGTVVAATFDGTVVAAGGPAPDLAVVAPAAVAIAVDGCAVLGVAVLMQAEAAQACWLTGAVPDPKHKLLSTGRPLLPMQDTDRIWKPLPHDAEQPPQGVVTKLHPPISSYAVFTANFTNVSSPDHNLSVPSLHGR